MVNPNGYEELVTKILHVIPLKKPCDCSCCQRLTDALSSGLLCQPLSVEEIADIVMKNEGTWKIAQEIHKAMTRKL